MASEPLWVFDTNVIVSALLFEDSVPGRAFFHALDSGKVLQSRETLQELQEVLGRKKFNKYLTPEERDAFLVRLTRTAVVVDTAEPIRACRDPKDDKVLELAVAGGASGIITGDDDLLALNPFRDIPILTPARFLELHPPQTSPPPADPPV
jgi:putative PIN family toxin of toxin-antitoxin system